jgi:hypothetical protein
MSREIARWAIMCGGGNGSRAFPDYGHVKFTKIPPSKTEGAPAGYRCLTERDFIGMTQTPTRNCGPPAAGRRVGRPARQKSFDEMWI